MKQTLPRLVITAGEPAGIGPDLVIALSQREIAAQIVVIADPELLSLRANTLGVSCEIRSPNECMHVPGGLDVIPEYTNAPVESGRLNPDNATYVLACLQQAIDKCLTSTFDALVTGPIHKGVINDGGFPFKGHTEFLAEKTHTPLPVMMLASEDLRVALVTTHLPLKEVSCAITQSRLRDVLRIVDNDLKCRFAIESPRISVCGLNPHAGEGGHLGIEEQTIISPVMEDLRKQGLNLIGPLPADTAFIRDQLADTDAVVAMYHDQGLPVVKHQGFGEVVNITLGLPMIRTSVDHGTALDLAGSGRASEQSLVAAVNKAIELVGRKQTA